MMSRRSPRATVLPLLIAASVLAAPLRNSQRDAIYQSDLIIVGDVVSIRTIYDSTFMDCHATIRPVRVLNGEPRAASRDVAVHWQYAPRPDETAPANLEGTHALWFLKKGSNEETYEAMWVNLFQIPMGGYFQPVPAGEPHGIFAAVPEANAQRKIAGELGSAMEIIARAEGSRLDMAPVQSGQGRTRKWFSRIESGGAAVPRNQARDEFQSLASLYHELDPAWIRAVDRHLIEQPEIHLKAVGFAGELRARSVDALLMMEKVYPQLARAAVWPPLSLSFEPSDIEGNEAAIRALGTICVSNEHLFGFEYAAVGLLAGSRSRFALPYLQAMLIHPQEPFRANVAQGICKTFASDATLQRLVDASLIRVCSFTTIAANRIGNHGLDRQAPEMANAQELREWLSAHTSAVQAATGITPPPAPAWLTQSGSASR
jgi:hypothetical protein